MGISTWELVWTCFRKLVESHTYQDKWICNKTLIRLLRTQSPSLTNAIGFNLCVLNRALSSHSVECNSGLEKQVLFRKVFMMRCLYDDNPSSTTKRRVYFYYWHQNGNWPANPGCPAECNDDFVKKPNVEPIAGVVDDAKSLLEEEVNTNATSTPKRVTHNNKLSMITPPGRGETRPSVNYPLGGLPPKALKPLF